MQEREGLELNLETIPNSKIKKTGIFTKKNFREIWKCWPLYLLLLPTLIYVVIFLYGPMYGELMAFQDFSPTKGIWGSHWVGFKHFIDFLTAYNFWTLMYNTLILSFYSLLAGFPIPIIFALLLNSVGKKHFKKVIQTASYAPHFISTVVIVGMMGIFFSETSGLVNLGMKAIGIQPIFFLGTASWFKHLYVWTGIWQNMGWASIIYIATLTNISPELYEAATMDGANRFQKMLNIDVPSIMPTAVILLILDVGSLLSVGFEKVLLMQNNLNIQSSEVIATYVYKTGLLSADYSFSAAVTMFNSIICLILLVMVNSVSKKLSDTSLW